MSVLFAVEDFLVFICRYLPNKDLASIFPLNSFTYQALNSDGFWIDHVRHLLVPSLQTAGENAGNEENRDGFLEGNISSSRSEPIDSS